MQSRLVVTVHKLPVHRTTSIQYRVLAASPFSIQQLTKLGKEKYGKSPGDWYGPELFSQIVADLMNGTAASPGIGQALGIQTVVARGSVVYVDVVRQVFGGPAKVEGDGKEVNENERACDALGYICGVAGGDEGVNGLASNEKPLR